MHYNKNNWKWPLVKFWPHEISRMLTIVSIAVMVLFLVIFFFPFIFIPVEVPANPLLTPEHIKPEWYFIGSYQALKIFPSELLGISFQTLFILALILVPFWDRSSNRHLTQRKWLLLLSFIVLSGWIYLTVWGILI
jgi:ubiquinol-cytochrome c reductase cytochrome b subunit